MHAKPKTTVELSIPVIHDMELAATNTAEVVAKHMDLNEEATAEISMALIEACLNAFEHSRSDGANVFIHFIIEEDTLIIKVEDKGVGFESEKVEIPDIDDKLKGQRKRGWGLQIIKELMDSVEFESSESGTTVTMVKNK